MDEVLKIKSIKKQPFIMVEKSIMCDALYLDVYDKVIYSILCGYADNNTSESYPSRRKISEMVSCSVRRVDKSISNLINHGLMKVEKRKRKNGSYTSNLFTLLEVPMKFFHGGGASCAPPPGASDSLGVVHEVHQGGASDSHPELDSLELDSFEQEGSSSGTRAPAGVYDFYQQNFGVLNSFVGEEIGAWCDDLSSELVVEAMKKALGEQKKWNYAKGILKNWFNRGVKSMADVEGLETEFKKRREDKKGNLYRVPRAFQSLKDWADEE